MHFLHVKGSNLECIKVGKTILLFKWSKKALSFITDIVVMSRQKATFLGMEAIRLSVMLLLIKKGLTKVLHTFLAGLLCGICSYQRNGVIHIVT